jgi:flagellar basal-body rod protein FlgG
MDSLVEATLDAMRNDVSRLERIATNLANVTTPGYKRELWVQRAHAPSGTDFAQVYGAAGASERVGIGSEGATATIERDLKPGTLRPTGQPLDLALAGSGFFEVATDHGPAFTRHGQFRLDARGRIVNAQGHALIGRGGEISLTSADVNIDDAGRIQQAGRVIDQIKVVDFAAGTQFTAVGAGLLETSALARPLEDAAVRIRQGHLENANVDTAHEMVTLMQTMRHFESMLRAAQGYDEMLGGAIRKLGDI